MNGSVLRINFSCCFPSCPAGELFAQAPVQEYPGIAVETVSDSSRYFVLRIQDDNGEDVKMTASHIFGLNNFNCLLTKL